MKLTYQRSGGFSGMVRRISLDTKSLPPDEAQELESLVKSIDFFSLPAQISSDTSGADRFQYAIAVDAGERRHQVVAGESDLPEDLRPLVKKLELLSRPARGGRGSSSAALR